MDLIILDKKFNEVKVLDKFSLDIDLAGDKSFSIQTEKRDTLDFELGWAWYIPNTEYGGIIDEITVKTESSRNDIIQYSGRTWRGWLNEYVWYLGRIEIEAGETYTSALGLVIAVTGINEIGDETAVDYVKVDDDYKDLRVKTAYTSSLYPTVYDFLVDFANSLNANIRLEVKKKGTCALRIGFVEKKIITSDEFTKDNTVYFEAVKRSRGINHLVCLGSGEYPNRTIIHLYLNDKGEICPERYFFGKDHRTAIYDYPNAENQEELRQGGIERLNELAATSQMTISIESEHLSIGDKVRCVDELTGLKIESEISSVIFKLETCADGENSSIEYVIEEEV